MTRDLPSVTEQQKIVWTSDGQDFEQRVMALQFSAKQSILGMISPTGETAVAFDAFLAKVLDNADDVVAVLQRYVELRDQP